MDAPITDRKRLVDLRKWVVALQEKRSYRWIASKTWRGAGSHGYWERIAKGVHLTKRPALRPRVQDWYDIRLLWRTVNDYDSEDGLLFDAAMQVVAARAELDRAVADLLAVTRRRTGRQA